MSTGFVPSSDALRCASPGNLGQQRSRGISVLAGERAQGFGLHASSGIGGLAVLSTARCCTDLPWLPGDRKTSAVAALAGGADLRMKWFASSVFWKASIVCSPSFCMERACGSVRVFKLRVKDLDFRITARSSWRARAPRMGLDVTRELGTQPARAAIACTAWWLKDQAEGRSGVALPDALERKYPRAGHSPPWFWVFAQHTYLRPIHGAVSCVAITCMTRPFSAPSNVP